MLTFGRVCFGKMPGSEKAVRLRKRSVMALKVSRVRSREGREL